MIVLIDLNGYRCGSCADNMTILFDDGMAVEVMRRERPWVMLDTDGYPLYLVTGCETCDEP